MSHLPHKVQLELVVGRSFVSRTNRASDRCKTRRHTPQPRIVHLSFQGIFQRLLELLCAHALQSKIFLALNVTASASTFHLHVLLVFNVAVPTLAITRSMNICCILDCSCPTLVSTPGKLITGRGRRTVSKALLNDAVFPPELFAKILTITGRQNFFHGHLKMNAAHKSQSEFHLTISFALIKHTWVPRYSAKRTYPNVPRPMTLDGVSNFSSSGRTAQTESLCLRRNST